jgi:hypothetical protein
MNAQSSRHTPCADLWGRHSCLPGRLESQPYLGTRSVPATLAVLLAWVLMAAFAGASLAQEGTAAQKQQDSPSPKEADKSESRSPWQGYFRRLASEYRMTAGDSKTELTRVDEPVLKWSQPVRGGQDGAVYVWLHEGRPAAIGAFFIWPERGGRFGVSHELHALLSVAIQGDWRQRVRWRPGKYPVEWRLLPDAPAPPDSKAKQSIEGRRLARRFAGSNRNRAGQSRELRLLPRPFYEYAAETKDGLSQGGALFALVEGTDTEVVLWLEARAERDKLAWHYACARMSDLELRVTLDDKEVWKADFARFGQLDGPYLCVAPEFLREPPPEP